MELKFRVQTQIGKPVEEVFDAVYNPKKLSAYFTNGGASAPLDPGTTVQWTFNDNPEQPITVPVKVVLVVPNERIRFLWQASEGQYEPKQGKYPRPAGYDNTVEITFEALGPGRTLVTIVEGTWSDNQGGLEGSYGNCQGWTAMVLFLKAYVEYGINLRKGGYHAPAQ